MILVPLRVFSLKRSTAGALGVPLRILRVFFVRGRSERSCWRWERGRGAVTIGFPKKAKMSPFKSDVSLINA